MISAALKLAASRAKALVPAGTGAYVGSKMAKGRDRLTGRNRRAPTAGVDVAEGHDRTNKLFGLQIGWDLFDRAMSKVNANAPTFTHSITVSCQGGPLADLRRVYYLALAAAFGRWSNGVAGELKGSTTSMVAHIDVTGKAVAVNISYTTLAAVTAVRSVTGFSDTPLKIIQQGPDQVTVGGSWPSFLQTTTKGSSSVTDGVVGAVVGGLVGGPVGAITGGAIGILVPNIPSSQPPTTKASLSRASGRVITGCSSLGYAPVILVSDGKERNVFAELPTTVGEQFKIPWGALTVDGAQGRTYTLADGRATTLPLPDAGRVITTGEKFHPLVQPPKPPIDGNTRGSLVTLVTQALASPCYLPAPVPCNPRNPLFSTGLSSTGPFTGLPAGTVYVQEPPGVEDGTGNGAVPRPYGIDGGKPLPVSAPLVKGP